MKEKEAGHIHQTTTIEECDLKVVPIHRYPKFLKECCDLVNQEWPRSETARMMSLKASCDKMPTSLILLSGDKKVIGHCKLTPIPNLKESCFIESVVIDKSLRGKGLGSYLMNASENYCRSVLSLSTIHLSTKGQEIFYERLGYKECEPISIYGSYPYARNQSPIKTRVSSSVNVNGSIGSSSSSLEPPLPPPQPLTTPQTNKKINKTYMVKSII